MNSCNDSGFLLGHSHCESHKDSKGVLWGFWLGRVKEVHMLSETKEIKEPR